MSGKDMKEILLSLWFKVFKRLIDLKVMVNDRFNDLDAYQSTELAPRLDKIDSDIKSLTSEIQALHTLINDLI